MECYGRIIFPCALLIARKNEGHDGGIVSAIGHWSCIVLPLVRLFTCEPSCALRRTKATASNGHNSLNSCNSSFLFSRDEGALAAAAAFAVDVFGNKKCHGLDSIAGKGDLWSRFCLRVLVVALPQRGLLLLSPIHHRSGTTKQTGFSIGVSAKQGLLWNAEGWASVCGKTVDMDALVPKQQRDEKGEEDLKSNNSHCQMLGWQIRE